MKKTQKAMLLLYLFIGGFTSLCHNLYASEHAFEGVRVVQTEADSNAAPENNDDDNMASEDSADNNAAAENSASADNTPAQEDSADDNAASENSASADNTPAQEDSADNNTASEDNVDRSADEETVSANNADHSTEEDNSGATAMNTVDSSAGDDAALENTAVSAHNSVSNSPVTDDAPETDRLHADTDTAGLADNDASALDVSAEAFLNGDPSADQAALIPPAVNAGAAVVIDAETGLILYEKEKDTQHYPASITKILTALLTLELCEDLNDKVLFSRNAVYSLPRDASHIAMDEGETLTLYDALHGLLMASANEVANALAEHIAGNNEDFAVLMNKRAEGLGALASHFENPSGLFSPGHVTSAYDMALIMQAAVKYPVFTEIIAKRRYDIPPTEKQADLRELLNTHRLIQPGPYYNEWVVGGKTGYTEEAQHTLVTYAEDGERKLIVVVMRDERLAAFEDTNALLAYGFALPYSERLILQGDNYQMSLPVYQTEDGQRKSLGEVGIKGASDVYADIPLNYELSDIRYELLLPEELTPPVAAGEVIGSVICYAKEVAVGTVKLVATDAVWLPAPETESVLLPSNTPVPALANPEEGVVEAVSAPPEREEHYYATLVAPLAASLIALVISFWLFFSRRKRRRAQIIRFDRYSQGGGDFFRYRS